MFGFKLIPHSTKFIINSVRHLPRGTRNLPSVGGRDNEEKWPGDNFKEPAEFRLDNRASYENMSNILLQKDKHEKYEDDFDEVLHNESESSPSPYELANEKDPQILAKMKRMEYLKRREIPVEDETLLTWAAMDQIRELHAENPTLWTSEKIADSFPISVEGARRFLRSRPPNSVTPEQIKAHDAEVEKRWTAIIKGIPGVVSERTLFMLAQGLIKFLPMRSFGGDLRENGNRTTFDDKIRIKFDETEILPNDGPFTRLYKRHLQWKNTQKLGGENDENEKTLKRLQNDAEMIVSSRELLNSVIFSNENREESGRMRFEDFQNLMKQRIRASRNRLDRKYHEWSEHNNKTRRR